MSLHLSFFKIHSTVDLLVLRLQNYTSYFYKKEIYNHFHNILRLFDVLPNFPFTTNETEPNYPYKQGTYKLPHKLPNDLRLRILGN